MIKKKKNALMAVLLAAMAVISGIPVFSAQISALDAILIGLKYGASAPSSGTISSGDPLLLGRDEGGGLTQVLDLNGNTSVSFSCEDGGVTLRTAGGDFLANIPAGSAYIVYPTGYEQGEPISFADVSYRGGILLRPTAGNRVNVINYIKRETYLEGVLNAEMTQAAPLEALKAQAVAARNFAVVKQNVHQADGFNLCASNHCQVYNGVASEFPNTSQAVRETEGLLMYADGVVVEAYYSKNVGGYTNNSEDVWSAALSYARAVRDAQEPDYPWTASFSLDEVRAKAEKAGFLVGRVQSISVVTRSVSGSVSELEIKGSNGTATLKKEQIRTVFGTAVVKSLKFSFGDMQTVSGGEPIRLDSGGPVVLGSGGQSNPDRIYVLNADGEKERMDADKLVIFNGSIKAKAGGQAVFQEVSWTDRADLFSGQVTFTGKGYGHGVGMSQDGAIQMARQGRSFKEILAFYYTNIEIH